LETPGPKGRISQEPKYAHIEHIRRLQEAKMPITGIYGPDDLGTAARPAEAIVRARITASERARALPMPSLEWTPEVERATAHLYARVKSVIPEIEWPFMAPYVKAINDLKKERDAVILAHNYQTPEIFHCVADIGGDRFSLRARPRR
jgi:quinolinate synthase